MDFQLLINKVEKHVRRHFKDHPYPELPYHNINHTAYVAKHAKELGVNNALNGEQLFEVVTASWFHDVGYLEGEVEHEIRGAKMAVEYLESLSVTPDIASIVSDLILATKMPVNPKNLLEEIICDADTYHLGKVLFFEKNKLLKNEREMLQYRSITEKEWLKQSIAFLENHSYHTEYSRNLLLAGKYKNLQTLRRNYQSELLISTDRQEAGPIEIEEIDIKRNKELHGKGIETMFTIMSGTNQYLNSMADSKAYLLITVNSILLSAIISLVIRKLPEFDYLIVPSCILMLVALLSIILSILSTKPTVHAVRHNLQNLDFKKINILFVGNYSKMSREDFTVVMHRLMDDWDSLHEMQIRDIHFQGVVVCKKYHYLEWAYNTFMFGLIISVLALIIAISIHKPGLNIIKP
jgi:predicted metal-dependent HD superfamily phosphohydrolase